MGIRTMKNDIRISKITFRDPKSTMSPAEYKIWKARWDKLLYKLIGKAIPQIKEDRGKDFKFVHTPKQDIIEHSFELAEQLNISLPKSIKRLLYDDVFLIEQQLEYELHLRNMEKDGCEVVFEPPRMPSSKIIYAMINRAKLRKARKG